MITTQSIDLNLKDYYTKVQQSRQSKSLRNWKTKYKSLQIQYKIILNKLYQSKQINSLNDLC